MFKRNQRGDTILEVLISVAVLALILTTTFALANRNSQATRQAAERGEAQKIAQSQMEKLKLYLSSSGAEIPDYGSYFCMNQDGTDTVEIGTTGDGPNNPFDDKTFQSPVYQNAERESQDCKDGVNDMYYSFIQRGEVAAGTQNLYTAIVRWPAVTGNGVDQVTIVHIIHPEIALGVNSSQAPCVINNNIAIALDRSGSMEDPFSLSENRITAAKRILRDFFANSDIRANGNRASLSVWGGNGGINLPPETLQPMTTSFPQLSSALDRIILDSGNNGRGTDLRTGLDEAYYNNLRSLPAEYANGRNFLILITDGLQTGFGSANRNQVVQRADEIKNSGVSIYALGIYPGSNPSFAAGESLLQDVSSDPDSTYYTSADNPNQLSAVMGTISNTLDC